MDTGCASGDLSPRWNCPPAMGLPPKVPDHCLLYLADRADVREDEPAAQDLTQERIAEALSVRRPHVSRAMGKLGARGLVKTAKVHVRGETRRRLADFFSGGGGGGGPGPPGRAPGGNGR